MRLHEENCKRDVSSCHDNLTLRIHKPLTTFATTLGCYLTSVVSNQRPRTNISEEIKQLSEDTNHDLALFYILGEC